MACTFILLFQSISPETPEVITTAAHFFSTVGARATRVINFPHVVLMAFLLVLYLLGGLFKSAADAVMHFVCHRIFICGAHSNRVQRRTIPRRIPSAPFTEPFCRDNKRSKTGYVFRGGGAGGCMSVHEGAGGVGGARRGAKIRH